ncbi:hypothetical protein [Streptosporangium sp. NPDC001681]|uniref:hypothetical protein n=1 Tax=Streptosporangium sp. NPDC001681 TaxID=3154395 RepID=UPI0033289195
MSPINPLICLQCLRPMQYRVPQLLPYLIEQATDQSGFIQFAVRSGLDQSVIAEAEEDAAHDWNRLIDALAEAWPSTPMEVIQTQAAAFVAATPAFGAS